MGWFSKDDKLGEAFGLILIIAFCSMLVPMERTSLTQKVAYWLAAFALGTGIALGIGHLIHI